MKRLLVLALVLLVGVAFAGTGPKVTGGGTVDWPNGRVTYGFNAQQIDVSGEAKGQFQVHHRDVGGLSIHGEVLYLAVNAATGEAWIGGAVTHSDDPSYDGLEFYFEVKDGAPDMVSPVTYNVGVAINALSMPALFLQEWTNGNVKIH
ncbi:MAG: hypothetical protein ABIH26_04755 [Candidatus Eisenbacteria bacterium]